MVKRVALVAAVVVASWVLGLVALACGGPFVVIIGDADRAVNCAIDADVTDGTVVRIPSGLHP